MRVGYLGPEGSFSDEATSGIFPGGALMPFSSVGLIKALGEGEIDKAVLPVENSIEGQVPWALDALFGNSGELLVEGEIAWRIRQNLIGFGRIGQVQAVYSIPQALGQCSKFLGRLGVRIIDVDSTSAAVRLVAERKDPQIAAIGTERAAEIYGVPIIRRRINDNRNNATRFVVLGRERKERTGSDKTSLIFRTKNKSGALDDVLKIFAALGINMTMIIERPSKVKLGQYVFFVDIEGHQDDENEYIKVALRRIGEIAIFCRILGSYPKAR